jgi:hypothetical protein
VEGVATLHWWKATVCAWNPSAPAPRQAVLAEVNGEPAVASLTQGQEGVRCWCCPTWGSWLPAGA